jgi:tRNA-specific 2-thiouridylase
MSKTRENRKILIAMSGGVDSAVSAMLLKNQGHEVESVYVRTWEHEEDLLGDCPGAKDLQDAKLVSEKLNIPFRVVNYTEFYRREVVLPMVNGYADGITPNPDILCNKQMKFGALMNYAKEQGFDALATGHYCIQKFNESNTVELWEGMDKNKDQSYFLARLSNEQIRFARFPIGQLEKTTIRKLAHSADLPVANKKDSQGICFLGKVKVPEFLSHFIEDNPGDIVDQHRKKLGKHKGLHRYTLGQRRGIGVPSNMDHENFVVTGKDETRNELIIALERPDEPTLWGKNYGLENVQFLDSELATQTEIFLLGKARYRDPSTQIHLIQKEPNSWIVQFKHEQRALTPGQVLAFYRGEQLIGSGIYSHSNLGRSALSS